MKKKSAGNQAGESHSGKARQWASQVLSITENTGRGGIEILFDAEPSPQLQPKLRAMSFRNSRTKSMWYGERTEEARKFAEKVMQVLPANTEGPELLLSPSFEALKTNLERKAFSFVIFSLKDGQTTSYVVFEPSKPKAEVIAMNFARRTFEDEPSALAVLPKTHIKEARTLFDEGKIIHPDDSIKTLPVNTKETKHIMSDLSTTKQVTGEKVPVKSILLTTESVNRRPDYKAGVALSNWTEANAYVKSKIGTQVSGVYYKITWQGGDLFGGMIDLQPADFFDEIDEPLSNHLITYLTNYSRATARTYRFYDKDSAAYALHLLQHCQLEDAKDTSSEIVTENEQHDVTETPADGQRQLESQALNKFFKWAVLQDDLAKNPERVTLPLMTKWFNEHMPELNSDTISRILERYKWLQKFLKAGNRKSNLLHPFDTIYKKILKVIPNLIDHIKAGKTAGKSKVDPEGGLMALNYDFVGYDKNGNPVIALSHYFKQEGDMVADPDMQIRLIPEKEIAEALTFQDQVRYQEVYTEREGKTFVRKKLRKDLNSFLNTWLTNIIHQGHKIDLSKEEADEPNEYRKAWELLTQLVPDLLNPAGKALNGTATISGKGTVQQRGITCTLAQRPDGDYEVSLIDSIGANDRLHFGIGVNLERKTALVDYEWFRAGNARIYDRSESQKHIMQRGGDLSEEMTKGLIRWLEEVVSLGVTVPLTVPLNPFAERETANAEQEKALWNLIHKVLPDLKLIPGTEQQGKVSLGEDTPWLIRVSLGPRGYIGDFDLHFTEIEKGLEQIRADVLLMPKEERAEVYSIYTGGDWARRAFQKSDDDALLGNERDEAKEMNAELMAWLDELVGSEITISLEPAPAEKDTSDVPETKHPAGAMLSTGIGKQESLAPGRDYEILNLLYHWLEEQDDQHPESLTLEQFNNWMAAHFPEIKDTAQQQIWKTHLSTRKTITEGLNADNPQNTTPSSMLLSGSVVFDPQLMAEFIKNQNYLLKAWTLSYPKNVLQQKTFGKEDLSQLRAFFSIYVQEDIPTQAKYLDLYREQYTETVDLTFQETGTPLPNVLVPNATKEPFYSHDWRTYDMRSLLQHSFVSLTELNNENLSSASPIQLYELAQLGNPTGYRIAVSQEKLIEIWRRRGNEIFDILGLPTHPAYPYGDLIAGYENIMSLGDLLQDGSTTGKEWWIAASLYRPIADLAKADNILDEMLANKQREKQSYLTADGQRPRPNYKSRIEQMDRTISYIEESRMVLQKYVEIAAGTQKTQIKPEENDQTDQSQTEVEEELPEERSDNRGSRAADFVSGEHYLPNVLVPQGTREPFLSHAWSDDIDTLLKREFTHLLKLKEKDIATIAPLAMFELIQLGHPDQHGINVSRVALIDEWEKRGESIFQQLGFPTDLNYPYANLFLGYQSVESLGRVLHEYDKERIKWWSVAEAYRPIADVKKALDILSELNLKFATERAVLVNPKTGKPKQQHQEKARKIDFAIRNLEESRVVLQAYLQQTSTNQTNQSRLTENQAQKEDSLSREAPDEVDSENVRPDPLTNDSGVYTKHTAGENLEEIVIPMPKTAQYTAEIQIAKTSWGTFKKGITAMKNFGDYQGMGYAPGIYDTDFPSRNAALKAALVDHEKFLESLLRSTDSNEKKENKQLSMALKAVLDFAREKGIELDDAVTEGDEESHGEMDETPESETRNSAVSGDPQTNEDVVYPELGDGDNLEELVVPMPNSSYYRATIYLVKTSAGLYRAGISGSKSFGDYASFSHYPRIGDEKYTSRGAALKAGILLHEQQLQKFLAEEDSALKNESVKQKRLMLALEALKRFAQANTGDPNAGSEEKSEYPKQPDPLANEDGYYTSFSAGKHFETLEIPMPKSSSYHATVYIVTTSAGNYKEGVTCGKHFGDVSYHSNFPHVKDESYPTRKSALKAALLDIAMQLEIQLATKDAILDNEATKHRRLTIAMNALKQFTTANGISLEAVPDPEEPRNGFIEGLEAAYWRERVDKDPKDLAVILGIEFHHRRLREAIAARLETVPLLALKQIVDDLVFRFPARVSLEVYAKSFVRQGQSEEEQKRALIVAYVDDLISFNDQEGGQHFPIMTYLIDTLFSGSSKLADVPVSKSDPVAKGPRPKRQSQHELNKEIEAFIDEKDKSGEQYDESEKNYLRQYTGSGGLLAEGASGRGTLYEYYTPDGLVKKMWDMAYHYGYDGGSILEPAAGTGNFLKYAPKNAAVYALETNHYACRVAQILYPNAHIQEKAFESLFFTGNIHLKDKFVNPGYSLVIGNPPYGTFTGKYAGLGEKQYTGATEYDQYFTLRSLDLLKPGGLLVFLVPSYFMLSMQKYDQTKKAMIAKAEWVDGYRLPKSIFPNTDVGTDIIVLRKRM